MSVRKAYWTSEEAIASIARRFGITPDDVEGLGQWRLHPHDSVPKWASPGKPRSMKRSSIMDLFALPPEGATANGSGRPGTDSGQTRTAPSRPSVAPSPPPIPADAGQRLLGAVKNGRAAEQDERSTTSNGTGRNGGPELLDRVRGSSERPRPAAPVEAALSDADIVELRETYVEEPGILDSIAEAFELPRARVIRLLKGEERPEAGGPIYRSLDVDALTI